MRHKKVLMWWSLNDLKPIGGPSGYLNNVFIEHELISSKFIHFLPSEERTSTHKSIKSRLKKFLVTNFIYFKYYQYLSIFFKKKTLPPNFDIEEFDFIHFHDTISLFQARNIIANFSGKVILSSHCPKPLHLEVVEDLFPGINASNKLKLFERFKIIDEYSFSIANYLFFPCEEAKEPYLKWDFFQKIVVDQNKFIYCPSGTQTSKVNKSKSDIRHEFGIPHNAFVISFMGRHNEVKGFDKLVEIGRRLIEKNKDVYFLIGGNASSIKGLKNKQWIEIGFTNDPHTIINSSDLFILPNKETYFDLVLLEVLSLGIPILTTFTGGNKYFDKFDKRGIVFYNTIDDCLQKISDIKNDDNLRKSMSEINKRLYLDYFTTRKFLIEYQKQIEML